MNVAVLVSGRGSNLVSLLKAEREGRLAPATIVCVVSNKPGVQALQRATEAGKAALVVNHKDFSTREAFDNAVIDKLDAFQVDAVVLAGFMRLLTPAFIDHWRWRNRIINIHPSLLPKFAGAHAHRDVLEAGEHVSGCTVHFVDVAMDAGPIISRCEVPVLPGDTEETLAARVLVAEHELLPRAVQELAAGTIRREGSEVVRS